MPDPSTRTRRDPGWTATGGDIYPGFTAGQVIVGTVIAPTEDLRRSVPEAKAFLRFLEFSIHFTGSPKIVGIYAHDVAREYNIPFCFLDTEGKQLISLVKDLPIDASRFFKASVQEYMGAYGRAYEIPKSSAYRSQAQSWYPVAQTLAQMSRETPVLLREVRKSATLDITVDKLAQPLLDELARSGMLTITGQTATVTYCQLSSDEVREFLKGDWLEVYVWQEAMNAGFADDCQWGYKIVVDQKLAAILPSNELVPLSTRSAPFACK